MLRVGTGWHSSGEAECCVFMLSTWISGDGTQCFFQFVKAGAIKRQEKFWERSSYTYKMPNQVKPQRSCGNLHVVGNKFCFHKNDSANEQWHEYSKDQSLLYNQINSGQPQTQVKDEWLSCVSVIPFKKAFCSLQGGWIWGYHKELIENPCLLFTANRICMHVSPVVLNDGAGCPVVIP